MSDMGVFTKYLFGKITPVKPHCYVAFLAIIKKTPFCKQPHI